MIKSVEIQAEDITYQLTKISIQYFNSFQSMLSHLTEQRFRITIQTRNIQLPLDCHAIVKSVKVKERANHEIETYVYISPCVENKHQQKEQPLF